MTISIPKILPKLLLEKLYIIPTRYIEMVALGKARGLLLYGESSLGKSHRVKKVLERIGKSYVFVSGHITPLKFFEKLYQSKDDLVVFDDVDILGNLKILNMIKAGLNENSENVVEYHTSKGLDIPSSFIFNGQVIILLNDIPSKNSEHLKAIESRILKYHLKFDRKEILNILFEIADKHEIEGTTKDERLEVVNWIKEHTTRATKNLNIRLYLQAVDFYKWNKEEWEVLTFNQIEVDEKISLVLQGISERDFCEHTGLHRATFYRLKSKYMRLNTKCATGMRHKCDNELQRGDRGEESQKSHLDENITDEYY